MDCSLMSCGEVHKTDLKLANRSEEGISAMASLYSTKVTASGGRPGSIRTEDGLPRLKLPLPRALGGRADPTHPQQLFAGGGSAPLENPPPPLAHHTHPPLRPPHHLSS